MNNKLVVVMMIFVFIMGIVCLLIPTSPDPFMAIMKIFIAVLLFAFAILVLPYMISRLKED